MSRVAVVAMDIHKKSSLAVVMNEKAGVLEHQRVGHGSHKPMRMFLERFDLETDVVMEATFNWPWIADLAEQLGLTPHLVHPLRAREMAKGMSKTDRKDAIWLGRLFWAGEICPECYLAPPQVRARRVVFRFRSLLVGMRVSVKNNIHGQLHKLGILIDEAADLFGGKGRAILEALELPGLERRELVRKLGVLDTLQDHIKQLERQIDSELEADERAKIVMSIPGVGKIVGYAMLAEIGQIERFPNRRALAAYAGVLPLANESDEKKFARHTGKHCNRHLRHMVIEAVTGAVRSSPRLRDLYVGVRNKNLDKPGKARVAVARQIMELAWLLLTRQEVYREKPPAVPPEAKPKGMIPTNPHRVSPTALSAAHACGQAAS